MGSGDYGAKPMSPIPVATPPPVRATSPTVDSVSRPDVTVAQPQQPPAKPSGGKGLVYALVGLGAIAATAVVMFFVMRSPDKKADKPSDPQVAKNPAQTPADAATTVAQVTPDAAAVVPAPPAPPPATPNEEKVARSIDETKNQTKPGETKTGEKPPQQKKPPTETRPPPPPPDEIDEGGEAGDEIKEALMKAKEAFANGDYARQKKDIGLANRALNQLGRNPRIRSEILEACRQRGLDGLQ
jgi:hypothetical protein